MIVVWWLELCRRK